MSIGFGNESLYIKCLTISLYINSVALDADID